jgi:hypothetical protein
MFTDVHTVVRGSVRTNGPLGDARFWLSRARISLLGPHSDNPVYQDLDLNVCLTIF